MSKKISVGGQALIEGIMMKGPNKTAIAVRTPEKNIDIEYIEEKHIKDVFSPFGWPVIRGVVNFIESMIQGYKALMLSADKSGMTDLEEEEKANNKVKNKNPEEVEKTKDSEEKQIDQTEKNENNILMSVIMIIATVLGVALSIFLFTYLPALCFDGINLISKGSLTGLRPIFEGFLKIAIFLAYLYLVSLTKDIKRVFMYHGAEHKTIFCFERGLDLTVENVKKQERFHPRCGTSFMILMLVVGIFMGFVILTIFPAITNPENRILWVTLKILMIPLICGLGYELIKFCGCHNNKLTKIIAAPGLWVQRLTTKEPDDDMIEVAIASLNAVLPKENNNDEQK